MIVIAVALAVVAQAVVAALLAAADPLHLDAALATILRVRRIAVIVIVTTTVIAVGIATVLVALMLGEWQISLRTDRIA